MERVTRSDLMVQTNGTFILRPPHIPTATDTTLRFFPAVRVVAADRADGQLPIVTLAKALGRSTERSHWVLRRGGQREHDQLRAALGVYAPRSSYDELYAVFVLPTVTLYMYWWPRGSLGSSFARHKQILVSQDIAGNL